jgi:hypothetical protein
MKTPMRFEEPSALRPALFVSREFSRTMQIVTTGEEPAKDYFK